MTSITSAELVNLVYQECGDSSEERIPRGLVERATQTALDAISQLAIKHRPSSLRKVWWKRLPANQEVIDLPTDCKAVEHLDLTRGRGEPSQELHRFESSSHVAAEAIGPSYGWHYVSGRQIRIKRPDLETEYNPGVRIIGVLRYFLPPQGELFLELPEGGIAYVKARAARELRTAPGAQIDPQLNLQDLQLATEELCNGFVFQDAASPGPIPEASTI